MTAKNLWAQDSARNKLGTIAGQHNINKTGDVHVQRFRKTIAQINAGATLLAAIAGFKYRLVDAYAIAIGGAVGSVTTVDLLGTQSSSSVKLVAFAQASLTEDTLLRAGASGAAILAGGVSFVACDVNTAITVGKTGSDVDTATDVDFVLTYALDEA